jgi:hypothetical protein
MVVLTPLAGAKRLEQQLVAESDGPIIEDGLTYLSELK